MIREDAARAREEAAGRLLALHDLAGAAVRARGPEGEVAVLSAPRPDWDRLVDPGAAPLLDEIRALGFRYVALDLDDDRDGG